MNVKEPKVSVIMAAYNAERYIREAIHSILSQTFGNFEFLIVNDGSTDATKEILEQYDDPRIRVMHQSNQGCASARDRAIAQASGEYIAIMDADDISLPNRLEKTVAYLDEHPEVVLVGSACIIRSDETGSETTFEPPTEDYALRKCFLRYAPFVDPANLIRKGAFHKAGGYKVDHGFDYELYSRLAKLGKLAGIQEPLVIIRRHDGQFFRMGHTPEEHRKRRLKIRWLTLWRLKPPFFLFLQTLMWLCFEYSVHLLPAKLRHLFPKSLRTFFKANLPPDVKTKN
jgi:glycosyltransferase involved in cell wall biosynthesis